MFPLLCTKFNQNSTFLTWNSSDHRVSQVSTNKSSIYICHVAGGAHLVLIVERTRRASTFLWKTVHYSYRWDNRDSFAGICRDLRHLVLCLNYPAGRVAPPLDIHETPGKKVRHPTSAIFCKSYLANTSVNLRCYSEWSLHSAILILKFPLWLYQ